MKHIGIVGVTAEGAAECYRTICRESVRRLGDNRHPEITLHNRSFHEILAAQEQRNWNRVAGYLLESIKILANSGADFAIIPANSVHFALEILRHNSPIPILSIVDVTADECMKHGYRKVAILGVGLTLEGGLYSEPLKDRGISALLPITADQEALNMIIYQEIVPGRVTEKGIARILRILEKFNNDDCDAAILACTELPLVVNEKNAPLPCLDTTRLLALAAVDEALK